MQIKMTPRLMTIVAVSAVLPCAAVAQQTGDSRALAQENFQAADADGSNALTPDEFKIFMQANAEDKLGSAEMVVQNNAFGQAFGQLDGNGDGLITLEEFAQANSQGSSAQQGGGASESQPKSAPSSPPSDNPNASIILRNFQVADVDKNGGLTLPEFGVFMEANFGSGLVPRRLLRSGPARRSFRRMDKNGDGQVTLQEFQAARSN